MTGEDGTIAVGGRPVGDPQAAAKRTIQVFLRGLSAVPAAVPALALLLVFGGLTPGFFSSTNLIGLLPQIASLAVLAMGQTLVLLVRGLDLSVSAVIAATAVILSGTVITSSVESIPLAIGVPIAVGLLNGLLVTKRRVPPFIATYGTLTLVTGAQIGLTQAAPAGIAPTWMITFGVGRIDGVLPWSIVTAAFLFAVLAVILHRSKVGRWVYAVGSNPDAAKYAGISVIGITIACYVACALLAAVAGLMMGGFSEYINQSLGSGANLNSIAAALIGGVAFAGGEGTLTGAVLGVLVFTGMLNLLNLSGFSAQWLYILEGAVLIIAVGFQRFQNLEARKLV